MKLSGIKILFTQEKIFSRVFKKVTRSIIGSIQSFSSARKKAILLLGNQDTEKGQEIQRRMSFYSKTNLNFPILSPNRITMKELFSMDPILVFGPRSGFTDFCISFRPGTFDVDFETNPKDGWAWTDFARFIDRDEPDLKASQERLVTRICEISESKKEKCYVFGTGPSLEKARERSWLDGVSIVCNTIVRDSQLWHHIEPDFIVAGDAIYHFGFTSYAQAFRNDLKTRLGESRTLFVYPAQFHSIIRTEFVGYERQLVPIPIGWKYKVDIDLTKDFHLPNLGNVLGLLLLPLACTVSKNTYLWGFDGRAPGDTLFWKNSSKQSYPEFQEELQKSHPMFFTHYVPKSDPNKYVREVQGDLLDQCMEAAEENGWKLVMMHKSWTPTLNKRYIEGKNGI
jgi:hypothetical protein